MTGRHSTFLSRWLGWGALVLMACWASPGTAQVDGFEDLLSLKSPAVTPKPEFTVTLTPATAKAGDEVTLTVAVKLPKGFYIYSTTGAFDGRTRIALTETGLDAIDAEFVPDRQPKTAVDPFLKVEVSKFHGQVTWKKRYRVSKDVDPANVAISGELTGQYCTDGNDEIQGKCIPINDPPFEFKVALANAVDVVPIRFQYEERPKKGKTNPALLRLVLTPEDAKPGDKVTLSITMELDKGWHTFSLTQTGDGGLPTEIELESLHGLKAVGEGFKADRSFEVDKSAPGLILEVHHEHVTWSRDLEVLADAKPGQYGLKGRISYQTCEKGCLPARTVPFALGEVSTAGKVAREVPKATDVPSTPRTKAPVDPAKGAKPHGAAPAARRPQDQGLIGFLLTAIGFGLVSLLTPCVFPMVPITVSFFVKQSESEHHRPIYVAFVFCASIVATFTILGVGIAAIFGAAQLNRLANNPWLNIVIGTVFVVFAFNMLGMFEIRIPSTLLTFTANKEQAGGYLGAMFMALTFTLTSFTCTFAFAGTLLVAAAQGQFYWPIIGMLAFGAAFATPFFVLALVPSLLKKLPKSGGWMNSIKVVMGLIEIGAAVKFYSVADFSWNPADPMLFDFVFVLITWLVLSLTIALYLLGVFQLAHDVRPVGISVGRLVLVIAFLGLSGNLAVALITHDRGGGWLMDQIISLAPPRNENAAPAQGGATKTNLPEPIISHEGIWYALDVDKAIAHATVLNQPLLFDFTGVNCANCRKMELKMTRPHNRSRLEKFVLVQLYTDTVPLGDPVEVERLLKRNNRLQTEWFEDVSIPAYAVVTPDGKTILSTFSNLEQKDGQFAAFLDEGWKKWEEMPSKKLAERDGAPVGWPEPLFKDVGIWFILDSAKGIELAAQLNRPLLYAWTGVNNVQSRVAQNKMVQPQGSSHLQKFIPVLLFVDSVPSIPDRADARRLAKQNQGLLVEITQSVVIPSYAVLTPDGKTAVATYIGMEQKEGEFAAFLDDGWKKWEEMGGK